MDRTVAQDLLGRVVVRHVLPDVLRLVAGHLDLGAVGRIVKVSVDAFNLAYGCLECFHLGHLLTGSAPQLLQIEMGPVREAIGLQPNVIFPLLIVDWERSIIGDLSRTYFAAPILFTIARAATSSS